MKEPAIFVTGAAGGIGLALLHQISESPQLGNYRIIATDLPSALAPLSPADLPPQVELHPLDVTDQQALTTLVGQLADRYLFLGLAQLAGILDHGPALSRAPGVLRRLTEVNALAVAYTCDVFAALMLEQAAQDPAGSPVPDRSIVTVASNAGNGPRANMAAYGASKAFASHYTRSLGLELGPRGIRCNVVNPGTTFTPMVEKMWQGEDRSATAIEGSPELYRTGIPLGRVAQPADVAAPVTFLLSPAARHITLAELTVDAGATQR
ncbi:MAG TPA: SDR family oxidoreductase [Candidatus Rothia avicola]|uniref:SDR family oxidoreductase n=1 Tax=Candidatus Rothia avicola TaxID=2840478 RepID=A0A9D1ZTW8_9MICC|nr:SDR family oxidoreductase [Candidatus Rothia avicola]